ncbi:MAG: energy-coupling factor ABC transporter ATP-binding protein [bacterium]|nr:energy-coupling factor ABC transporter ATP-binding protein [bacterium]
MKTAIYLEDICHAYGSSISLRHISLEIKAGSCMALKGPNGCGKSTLLKIINGLVFPNKGRYLLFGEPVTKESMKNEIFSKKLHQKIGYIFQDSNAQLFSPSVYEEIIFGPLQMNISQEEADKRAKDCMRLLQIEHLAERAPYHLSGGEKKKTSIACILSMNPEILCLDEPIAGLDEESQELCLDILKGLKKAGKTIIIATHNNDLIKNIADEEYRFYSGRS